MKWVSGPGTNAFFYERSTKFLAVKNFLRLKKNFFGVKIVQTKKFTSLGIYPENFSPRKAKLAEICAFKVDAKFQKPDFCDFLFVFENKFPENV